MAHRKLWSVVIGICLVGTLAFAQEEDKGSEKVMTVEEAYLNSVGGVVIKEMIAAEGRDSKYVALQYVEDALNNGGPSEDLTKALDALATIGLSTVVRKEGRVVNNYPDVRMKACELLGKAGGEKAKDTLVKVLYGDNEPAVLMTAIHSLSQIGLNDNDEVVQMITWVAKRFDVINPSSSLALEILNAYEVLAPQCEDKRGMFDVIMRIASNYNYVTPVRNRALEVLKSVGSSSRGK